MKRKRPSFNESYYGFRTFSHLLEDAQRRGIVILRRDQKSGSYIIEDLGSAARAESAAAATPESAERKPEAAAAPAAGGEADANGNRQGRRRRGRGGRGRRGGVPVPAGAPSEAGAAPLDEGDDEEDDADDQSPEPSTPAVEAHASDPHGVGAAAQDRPSFSLFSWLRREPEDKKS
jgi:hypothetical protein